MRPIKELNHIDFLTFTAMILFEDKYIIAVNKPNNILVHHSAMANNKMDEENLIQLLKRKYGKKYYPIHRLDRKTSGIILFAKERSMVTHFQNLFITNQIQKTYYGIVRGFAPIFGVIDSDVKGRDADIYKTALTNYKTIQTKEIDIPVVPYNTSRYSFIELKPKTGRLHQLRIHLNKINHPLIGDPKYGDRFHNRMFAKEFNCGKLFLHAFSVAFIHPFTEENILITATFPEDWVKVSELFNWSLI